MNSNDKEVKQLQQTLCNLLNYIFWLYKKRLISEQTKYELVRIINTGEPYEPKRNK